MYNKFDALNRRASDAKSTYDPNRNRTSEGNRHKLNRRNYETFQKNNRTDYVPRYYIGR